MLAGQYFLIPLESLFQQLIELFWDYITCTAKIYSSTQQSESFSKYLCIYTRTCKHTHNQACRFLLCSWFALKVLLESEWKWPLFKWCSSLAKFGYSCVALPEHSWLWPWYSCCQVLTTRSRTLYLRALKEPSALGVPCACSPHFQPLETFLE